MIKTISNNRASSLLPMAICGLSAMSTAGVNAEESGSSLLLEEVVVTAQKRAEDVQDVPISITAFSGQAIEKLGLLSAKDIASQTPNMSVESPFGHSMPRFNLRGVGSNDFNSIGTSPVGVYVDEVFLNSPIIQGFQLFDLERVEVLRGPQGTLWGKNTTAGAIHFVSNKPGEEFEAQVRATYGRFDQADLEAVISGPLSERFSARVATQYQSRDGWVENQFNGNKLEDYEKTAVRAQLSYTGDAVDLLLNIHGGKLNSGGKVAHHRNVGDIFGYTEEPADRDHVATDSEPSEEIDTTGLTLTVNWEIGDMALTAITGYEDHERIAFEVADASPHRVLDAIYYSEADQWTQELRLASTDDSALQWILGTYWLTESQKTMTSFDVLRDLAGMGADFVITNTAELETDNIALFAHATYEFNERWSAKAGVRWTEEEKAIDMEAQMYQAADAANFFRPEQGVGNVTTVLQREKETWDEITGELGLDFRPDENTLIYGSVRRGFRGGNFNGGALFSQSEAVTVDPELLTAYEIGTKNTLFEGLLQLNASLFFYDYTDMQVFTLVNATQQLSNAGKAAVKGVELEAQIQPTENLYMRVGLGLVDAEYRDYINGAGEDLQGNRLPRSPETTFNGLLQYRLPLQFEGQVSLQLDFDYKDRIFFKPENEDLLSNGENYWLINARTAYETADGDIEISVWGKNLTDEEYLATVGDLSNFGFHQLYYGDPRTFGVTVNYQF